MSSLERPWFSSRWIIQEIVFARDASLYCANESVSWQTLRESTALFEIAYTELSRQGLHAHAPDFEMYLNPTKIPLPACRMIKLMNNVFSKGSAGQTVGYLSSLEQLVASLTPFKTGRFHDTIYAVISSAANVKPRSCPRSAHIENSFKGQATPEDSDPITSLKKVVDFYPVDYSKSTAQVGKDFV